MTIRYASYGCEDRLSIASPAIEISPKTYTPFIERGVSLTTTGFESHKKKPSWHYRLRRIQDGTAKVAQKESRLYTTGYDVDNVPSFSYL